MARGHLRAVSADRQGDNVVRVAELALGLLLASLLALLTSSKDLLSARLRVENYAQSGSHVHTLLLVVIVEVLARKITLVTVNKVNLILLVRRSGIDRRQYIRLLNRSNPRLTRHELVAILWRIDIELIIAGQAIRLSLFLSLSFRANMLRFELAGHF